MVCVAGSEDAPCHRPVAAWKDRWGRLYPAFCPRHAFRAYGCDGARTTYFFTPSPRKRMVAPSYAEAGATYFFTPNPRMN